MVLPLSIHCNSTNRSLRVSLRRADSFHYRQGIPSRLLVFPDENHWILKHGNRWEHLLLVLDVLDERSQFTVSNGTTRSSAGLINLSERRRNGRDAGVIVAFITYTDMKTPFIQNMFTPSVISVTKFIPSERSFVAISVCRHQVPFHFTSRRDI